MRDISTKVNNGGATADGRLEASEYNDVQLDIENGVIRSGQILNAADTLQMGRQSFLNAVGAQSFVDSGTTNAIVLTPTTGASGYVVAQNYTQLNGARIMCAVAAANTGAVTVNIGQTAGTLLGVKPLVDINGAALTSGFYQTGDLIELQFSTSLDKYLLINNHTKSANSRDSYLNKNVAGAVDVTLTISESAYDIINLTGAITANINIIVQTAPGKWTFKNSTTGNFTITVKTAAGTGVIIQQGSSADVYCDAVNVDYSSKICQTPALSDNSLLQVNTAFLRQAISGLSPDNKLVNGNFLLDEINNGAAITPATAGSASTQIGNFWSMTTNAASKLTAQVIAAPAGSMLGKLTRITVASQYAPAANEFWNFGQSIEGATIVDLGFGASSAAQITVSFFIKGSVPGIYSISINNASASTRSYVGEVNVTTTLTEQTITLIGDTTGTWNVDNNIGLLLLFDLGSGSNVNTTAGAWQAGNFRRTAASVTFVNQINGSTLDIGGVRLLKGGLSYPPISRQIEIEKTLSDRCQPIFNSSGTTNRISQGGAQSATLFTCYIPFKNTTRVAPTGVSFSNVSHFTLNMYTGIAGAVTGVTLRSADVNGAFVDFATTGMTTGALGEVMFNNASGQLYFTGCFPI